MRYVFTSDDLTSSERTEGVTVKVWQRAPKHMANALECTVIKRRRVCVFVPLLSAVLIKFQVSSTAELLKPITLATVIWTFTHRNVILFTQPHSVDTHTVYECA